MTHIQDHRTIDTPDNVPRVVHLGYFDAILDGVQANLTFDELRLRLVTVSNDLARFHGRRQPGLRTDPSTLWSTTRDALDGLMQAGLLENQPLPSRKETLGQYTAAKYALTHKGKDLLRQPTVGAQREVLGAALYQTHPLFRRYLQRLQQGCLFLPEFTETEIDRFHVRFGWSELGREVTERVAASPAQVTYDSKDIAAFLDHFVSRRFESRGGRGLSQRKELLDAVLDGVVGFVSREEGIGAGATTISVLHEWGRQLYLTGSSRYVSDPPTGALHWSACLIQEENEHVTFQRKVLPSAADDVVHALGVAYHRHLRAGTRLVEYYKLRGTAGFLAGVSNDLVDRVVAAMIVGQITNPYGLQPSSGAQWTPPPSERPLRIGDRRYTLVTFTHDMEG